MLHSGAVALLVALDTCCTLVLLPFWWHWIHVAHWCCCPFGGIGYMLHSGAVAHFGGIGHMLHIGAVAHLVALDTCCTVVLLACLVALDTCCTVVLLACLGAMDTHSTCTANADCHSVAR